MYEKQGSELRGLRKKTKESIFKVARNLNISGNYLSMIERGERKPSLEVLRNISNYYNVSLHYLEKMYNPEIKPSLKSPAPKLNKLILDLSRDKRFTQEEKEDILLTITQILEEKTEEKGKDNE